MHSYLRAIGFSNIRSRKQLEQLYVSTLKNPNRKIITTISVDTSLIQFEKDFAPSLGITLVGEYDVNGSVSIEHYFPYIKGENFSTFENIAIEKQTDKESYAGVCEDCHLGMTIIFYVLNIADYAKSKWLNYSNRHLTKVKLSGLSINGAILLGVKKTRSQLKYETEQKIRKNHLLSQARNGDTEAIENLTIDEMDTYTSLTYRIRSEDILSIVDTSLMPCGVECDHYMVVGNIIKVTPVKNILSNEIVYNLLVETTDLLINIAINSIDLQGEPAPGRRFRGEVWLQGYVQI